MVMRIRGACDLCGIDISHYNGVCWDCHVARRQANADPEARAARKRASRLRWYYNNQEHAQQKHKEWLENNREKVKQYEIEHVDERRGYVEDRRARLMQADGGFTAQDWIFVLMAFNHQCAYCLEKFDKLEQDHVVPLSQGGRHAMGNIVPACLPCNRRKSISMTMQPKHQVYATICFLGLCVSVNKGWAQ